MRKSGIQPTPGLAATLRGPSALCALPAACLLVQAAGEWTPQPGSRTAFLLVPAAQWIGQQCSYPGWWSQSLQEWAAIEEDVNLQGEAAKFPMGTYVCEAGRPALAAHIYQITIDHCLPIFKGKLTSLWLAYHDQASFGKQSYSSPFILSSLFFYLESERLNLYLKKFSSEGNTEIKNGYFCVLGIKAFKTNNIEKILWVICRRQHNPSGRKNTSAMKR